MTKKWNKLSEDEREYHRMMREQWHVRPSKKAVAILTDRINEVLRRLGVDTEKDSDSVKTQMEILGIYINSLDYDSAPDASGLYISAVINGDLKPYAFISSAKVDSMGYYWFPITYWQEERYDEGKGEKIIH